jgi:hypothetical protein
MSDEPASMAILDAALAYAASGWPVFPVHSIVSGHCTCGNPSCEHPGKHPRTAHGLDDASTDEQSILDWWRQWPASNIGLAAGAGGLTVIDVDVKDGLEHLGELELTTTRTAKSGGGGFHFYYQGATKAHNVLPGVHMKSIGGYVIAPPSLHVSGGTYQWVNEDAPIVPVPSMFCNGKSEQAIPDHVIQPDAKQWVAELLSADCPEGQRDTVLTRLAGYFRNILPPAVTLSIMAVWNAEHCQPPLSLRQVTDNVMHKYRRYAGASGDETDDWTGLSLMEADLHDPSWIVEGLLPEGLTWLAGRPKRGKSWLVLQIALDIVLGTASLGRPCAQGRVLYLALEDSPRRMKRRLALMGAAKSPELGNLIIKTRFPSLEDGGLAALIEAIEKYGPVLVVIDTLSRLMGRVDQDSNADMTATLDPIQKLALGRNIAIVVVDHHRKPGMEILDAIDDVIGSTAKTGVADAIWGLYRKSHEAQGTLKITGRDVEEAEFAMSWDAVRFHWKVEGSAGERALDQRIKEITAFLRIALEADLKTLASHLGLSEDTLTAITREMKARKIVKETTVTTGQRGRPRFVYSLVGE